MKNITPNNNSKHGRKEQTVGFLDSFAADTSVIPVVINRLISDLKSMNFPQGDIDEIVISMDESITNAVQETITKNPDRETYFERRDITIRYTLDVNEFDATIIDHGKGLDLFNILNSVPDNQSDKYHSQILDYASESEKNKLRVRMNGKVIPLKGIGTGLKIILQFMDSVTIDFIDKEKVLSNSVSEHTDGTIFTIKRAKRY